MNQYYYAIDRTGIIIHIQFRPIEDINPACEFVCVEAVNHKHGYLAVNKQLIEAGDVHPSDGFIWGDDGAHSVNMRRVRALMQPIIDRLDENNNTPIPYPSELTDIYRPLVSTMVGRKLRFSRGKVYIDKDVENPTYIHPTTIRYAYMRVRSSVEAAISAKYGCEVNVSRSVDNHPNAHKIFKQLLSKKVYDKVVKQSIERITPATLTCGLTSVQIDSLKKKLKAMMAC